MADRTLKLPPRFIQDCQECGCDVGEYAGGQLQATDEQLAELRSRAAHYADAFGPDAAPAGLKGAAKALLKALDAQQRLADRVGARVVYNGRMDKIRGRVGKVVRPRCTSVGGQHWVTVDFGAAGVVDVDAGNLLQAQR